MASGDLILSSGTVITAAEIQQIAAEVKKELAAESKELSEFEEVSSLTGVSSLPGIQQSGTTMRLVRVAMSVLKGVNGRDIELSASSTAIRWRYVGDEAWNTLVDLSLLKGNKGDPGDPVVLRKGDTGIEWKLQSEPDTAYRTLVAVADLRFSFSDLTDEEKGEITKIPILSEVSGAQGTEPTGAFVSAGRDTAGNPVYTLSLVVPRGERGLPPVIEMGTVTTILPDTEASATLVENGETDEGNPKYLLNLNIPAGRPGQDGDGAGNVYINETETMESGKLYLFQPGSDGTVNGYFIEFVGQGSVGQKNPDYTGAEYFNDYENNVSAGQYAHAEGRETNATGPRAHAERFKPDGYDELEQEVMSLAGETATADVSKKLAKYNIQKTEYMKAMNDYLLGVYDKQTGKRTGGLLDEEHDLKMEAISAEAFDKLVQANEQVDTKHLCVISEYVK